MASCPHCSETIESLSGFVDQKTLESRLAEVRKSKQGEIDEYAKTVSELRPQAEGHAALVAASAEWQSKYEGVVQQQERSTLLTGLSIGADKLPGFESLWSSAQAGKGEGERQDFAAWFAGDAKTHPLLSGMFDGNPPPVNGDTPGETPPAIPPVPPVSTLPRTPGPGEPPAPPPQGKMTAAQVQDYFGSAVYRALPPAEQKAKKEELRTQTAAT